jgi:hypothetical protein
MHWRVFAVETNTSLTPQSVILPHPGAPSRRSPAPHCGIPLPRRRSADGPFAEVGRLPSSSSPPPRRQAVCFTRTQIHFRRRSVDSIGSKTENSCLHILLMLRMHSNSACSEERSGDDGGSPRMRRTSRHRYHPSADVVACAVSPPSVSAFVESLY